MLDLSNFNLVFLQVLEFIRI